MIFPSIICDWNGNVLARITVDIDYTEHLKLTRSLIAPIDAIASTAAHQLGYDWFASSSKV